ncbi:hypothetical protein QL992_12725 [Microbacterium sp. APC 3898]|jgi:hypothetical protein|uniref:Uncharacterized protein n=2 Tax=Planococcus TaxID=1372 RepID=A0ABT7ZNQ0_9BACL|nr:MULTISPECIES: hypothetical protein [Terrabacteria group]MBD8016355.1 hypothetical protein [Planococcus wigleyi]MDN3428794.1 hypothetical protein [Planococcus sp. APC 4016]MDN3439309.1 hypothetical protein [Planococcus sp. APC 3900]MDN3500085.1 hypothetical protein [Microbacterium sp. APC 3898]
MGFWYFLILGIGMYLLLKGIFSKSRFSLLIRTAVICIGAASIAFSLFMFSPGSAEIISQLLIQE